LSLFPFAGEHPLGGTGLTYLALAPRFWWMGSSQPVEPLLGHGLPQISGVAK